MITRKNQNALSSQEWADFIDAINQTHGVGAKAPAYRAFVKVHERAMNPTDMQGMSWGVHTMGPMMRGRNFLSWHRQFVLRLELRLQKVHPAVTIPYWDAVTDRSIPEPLDDPALLASWGGHAGLGCESAPPQIRCNGAQWLCDVHGFPGGN